MPPTDALRLSALALFAALLAAPAAASTDCVAAGPIAPGLHKIVEGFHAADRVGEVTLSVRDFLIGVSDIDPPANSALAQRGPVKVARTALGKGSVANDGPADLHFAGLFAQQRTLFRIPQDIRATYATSPGVVTFYYDAAHAMQVGEFVLGMPFYRTIDHVLVAGNKLLFYFTDNDGADPDRCFVPS